MEVVQLRVSVLELRVAWMRTAWRMLEEKGAKVDETDVRVPYICISEWYSGPQASRLWADVECLLFEMGGAGPSMSRGACHRTRWITPYIIMRHIEGDDNFNFKASLRLYNCL